MAQIDQREVRKTSDGRRWRGRRRARRNRATFSRRARGSSSERAWPSVQLPEISDDGGADFRLGLPVRHGRRRESSLADCSSSRRAWRRPRRNRPWRSPPNNGTRRSSLRVRPTMPNSEGPWRTGSVVLLVWQVAHCCLNSVGPSGGFASGNGICAMAACRDKHRTAKTETDAKCRAQLCHIHHRWRRRTLGCANAAVVVAGCFA